MAVSPVLVIKTDDSSVDVRARLYDDFVEHKIILNSVITYWWANNLPPVIKFLELFESVIKRTVNELIPHKELKLKYELKSDGELENASEIEINLIEIEADGNGFKIEGKQLVLKGLSKSSENHVGSEFVETVEKTIETPDIVFKKYQDMKKWVLITVILFFNLFPYPLMGTVNILLSSFSIKFKVTFFKIFCFN